MIKEKHLRTKTIKSLISRNHEGLELIPSENPLIVLRRRQVPHLNLAFKTISHFLLTETKTKKIRWVLSLNTYGKSTLNNRAFCKDLWPGYNRVHTQNGNSMDMSATESYLLGPSTGLTLPYYFQDSSSEWCTVWFEEMSASGGSWGLLAPCCPEWYRHTLTHFKCRLIGAFSLKTWLHLDLGL